MYDAIYTEFKSLGIEITQNKYFRWYCSLIEKRHRESPKSTYTENHHWIPDCIGGVDTISLSAREHFISHMLLARFLHGTPKWQMLNSLAWMMKHKDVVSSRTYAIAKRQYTERMKDSDVVFNSNGFYYTPWGVFLTSTEAARCSSSEKINNAVIIRWCQDSTKTINNYMLARSEYLQSLSFDCVGMTLRELGFNFIKVEMVKEKRSLKPGRCGDGTNRGIKRWYNKETDEYRDEYECPGDGWINKGRPINSKGLYCHKDYGCYESAKRLADAMDISSGVLSKHAKKGFDVVIQERARCQSSYLKSFDCVGMTWKELGFSFRRSSVA